VRRIYITSRYYAFSARYAYGSLPISISHKKHISAVRRTMLSYQTPLPFNIKIFLIGVRSAHCIWPSICSAYADLDSLLLPLEETRSPVATLIASLTAPCFLLRASMLSQKNYGSCRGDNRDLSTARGTLTDSLRSRFHPHKGGSLCLSCLFALPRRCVRPCLRKMPDAVAGVPLVRLNALAPPTGRPPETPCPRTPLRLGFASVALRLGRFPPFGGATGLTSRLRRRPCVLGTLASLVSLVRR
jgi:hypothetical protein